MYAILAQINNPPYKNFLIMLLNFHRLVGWLLNKFIQKLRPIKNFHRLN